MKNQYFSFSVLITACLIASSFAGPHPGLWSSSQEVMWKILIMDNQCRVEEPGQVIIKSQAEFDDTWQKVFANYEMPPEQPEVDFNKNWVFGAFMGMKNRGGFRLDMGSMEVKDGNLAIKLVQYSPGPNCFSTMAIEYPYMFVQFEKPEAAEVTFLIQEEVIECD